MKVNWYVNTLQIEGLIADLKFIAIERVHGSNILVYTKYKGTPALPGQKQAQL